MTSLALLAACRYVRAPDLILVDMVRPAGSSEPALIRLPVDIRSIDLSISTDARLRVFWAMVAGMFILIELTLDPLYKF